MDSRCRILSARGCVAAPILFFSVWLYPFSTLVPLHRGTPTDSTGRSTSSVLWRHLVTLDTKASLPQDKAIHTFFFLLIRWFTLLDRKRIKTGLKRTNTHTSKPSLSYHAHHHVCLGPERMSCQIAAAQCSMDSSCTAGGPRLLCTFTPKNGWRHDPRDFILAYRTIVLPVGIIVYSAPSTPVFSFWIDMLNICDCHCCL